MPSTDTKNPNFVTVMKAILLFTTLWFGTISSSLPIINSHASIGGKSIKDEGISSLDFLPPDSSCVVLHEFSPADPSLYQIRTVVIDPGHGGHDPGCMGHDTREKHVVLAIGKMLANSMKDKFPNLNVIMTRSTDVFVPLHERASIATNQKADLFISIHCNAFPNSSARGTETYVLGLHATNENLEVAKRENESILLEDNYQENYGYDPNSPEAHIMFSMFQNAFLDQSISFAEKVQGRAVQHTGLKNRGVKQAGFLVLRHATMPSVLVETGYLTNGSDESYLMTDHGQQEMANALLNAFIEYKREMEKTGTETVATVSYIETKKPQPIVYTQPSKSSIGEKSTSKPTAKPTIPLEKNVAVSDIDAQIKEETEKAKKWGLEIGLPSTGEVPKEMTNVSPKKTAKILANIPVDEKEHDIVVKAETAPPPPLEKKESPKANVTISEIHFCVQLAASPTLLNVGSGKWTNVTHTVEVIQEAKLYKYQVRNFATLDEANSVKSQLRSKGFNDAFVVAYKEGKRVDPRTLQ